MVEPSSHMRHEKLHKAHFEAEALKTGRLRRYVKKCCCEFEPRFHHDDHAPRFNNATSARLQDGNAQILQQIANLIAAIRLPCWHC